MTIFGGTFFHTIDPKGRVNIPAQFRKIISGEANGQMVITKGLRESCLFVYPYDNWLKKMEELNALPKTEENVASIRIFASNSYSVEIDGQGRIVVPAPYLKEATLSQNVVVMGVMDKIELWNPEAHQQFTRDNSENYQSMIKKL